MKRTLIYKNREIKLSGDQMNYMVQITNGATISDLRKLYNIHQNTIPRLVNHLRTATGLNYSNGTALICKLTYEMGMLRLDTGQYPIRSIREAS